MNGRNESIGFCGALPTPSFQVCGWTIRTWYECSMTSSIGSRSTGVTSPRICVNDRNDCSGQTASSTCYAISGPALSAMDWPRVE